MNPLYYRFVFNPWDNNVIIKPEDEYIEKGLPQDCVQGYIYEIDGGLRVTNVDHKTINDPYIKTKIMNAMSGEESEPHTILKDRIGDVD